MNLPSAEAVLAHKDFFAFVFSSFGFVILMVAALIVIFIDARLERMTLAPKRTNGGLAAALRELWENQKITFLVMVMLVAGGIALVFLSSIPTYINLTR